MPQETNRFKVHFQLYAQGEDLHVRAFSQWGESSALAKLPPRSLLRQFQRNQRTQSALTSLGQALYQTLFSGQIAQLANQAIQTATQSKQSAQFEIRFDPDQTALAQYPWEIIADPWGRFLVREGQVDVSRYITYPQPPPILEPELATRPLLRVIASPANLPKIQADLLPLETIRTLEHASYQNLVQTLLFERLGLSGLQFDGHGAVFPRCPHCRKVNTPDQTLCTACGRSLQGAKPTGVLAFELSDGNVEWIPTDEFGSALYNAKVLFALLMACDTASLSGDLVFSSLAPNLILAGVPIVVGMQYPVLDRFANQFAQAFHQAFRQSNNLLHAVRIARRVNLQGEWYSPAVYMRYRHILSAQEDVLKPSIRSRQVDTAVPTQVQAGEQFLARLWIRRPETEALSPDELRAELNLAPDQQVSVEAAEAAVQFDPQEMLTSTGQRSLRRGQVDVSLRATNCEVVPDRMRLFVDEDLDAPPAIFTLRPTRTGRLSLTFEVWQQGGLIASALHQVLAVERLAKPASQVQTGSQTVPVDQTVVEIGAKPAATRPCPQCGNQNRAQAAFCVRCGMKLAVEITETPLTPPSVRPEGLNCPSCGTANRLQATFCTNCGTDLRQTTPAAPAAQPISPPQPEPEPMAAPQSAAPSPEPPRPARPRPAAPRPEAPLPSMPSPARPSPAPQQAAPARRRAPSLLPPAVMFVMMAFLGIFLYSQVALTSLQAGYLQTTPIAILITPEPPEQPPLIEKPIHATPTPFPSLEPPPEAALSYISYPFTLLAACAVMLALGLGLFIYMIRYFRAVARSRRG